MLLQAAIATNQQHTTKGAVLDYSLDRNVNLIMGRPRVELGTNRLKAECSTTELASHRSVITRPLLIYHTGLKFDNFNLTKVCGKSYVTSQSLSWRDMQQIDPCI